jgi:lipopolysaccharide transport system permease protein
MTTKDVALPHAEAHETVLEPRTGWRSLGLGELWERRELLYFFVWRDLKVRYKQTAFGAAWAVLQPLLLMAVFSLTVGRLPNVGPPGVPYPLFVFVGLVPWTLFASSLVAASSSLVASEGIITKVYFPRLLLPVAATGSYLADFVISSSVLALFLLYYGTSLSWAMLCLPAFVLMAVAAALGVGVWLAAINVRYRDVKYAVPFLVQLWLFSSPIIYTSTLVPKSLQVIYALNPMTGVANGFRWALVGGASPDALVFVSAAATAVVLATGLLYFRRVERSFADVI